MRSDVAIPKQQNSLPEEESMARQSSNALSKLASRVLQGARATQRDIMQLAASVLSQDETRGPRKAKKRRAKAQSQDGLNK